MEGDDLRQTLVTIGISIVAADLMLAVWSGKTYQFGVPEWLDGAVTLPIILAFRSNGAAVPMTYPFYRLVVLGRGHRHRRRAVARAEPHPHRHDDPRRRRRPRHALGLRRQRARGLRHRLRDRRRASPASPASSAASALSIAPGEDVRYLLASLVVVIVGGMGSITGAAIGALLIGLAEQIGLAYFPTYGIVLTFVIMVAVLAFRPQGIMGRRG